MKHILLDTDVILDFYFDREPFSNQAAHVLALCEQKHIQGFITPVIISNVYYMLSKTAKHELVIEALVKLLHIVDVLDMNKQSVLAALHSSFRDFEDALQYEAAILHQTIDTIVTRNTKDFKRSKIAVLTPTEFLSSLKLF
jgi:predicted nucleic acid-binding protein